MARPKPLVLIILDGWGYAPPSKSNAISLARKPTYDKLLREFPNTLVHTSGRYVGLPTGQMGNSEVGHLNIGAGRIVYMDITRLDLMIENGELFKHPQLLDAMREAQKNGRRLHFIGLLSDGAELVRQGTAEKINFPGCTPLKVLLEAFLARGGMLYTCPPGLEARHITPKEYIEGVKVMHASDFAREYINAKNVLSF